MKKDNPFTLTFGKQPNRFISRYENIDTVTSTFDSENPISQVYLIEGIRGSGKTVLMTTITNELAKNDDWIVVDLNSTQNLLEDLAMRLMDSIKKIPNLMEKGFTLSFGGFGIGVGGDTIDRDYISMIEELLTYVKKKNKKVIITIDEVMHDKNMKVFASQFQIFVRKDYPVYLLMTGLYENIYAVQNDPALTFLLRSPKIKLAPLSLSQITSQYHNIFDISTDEARMLASITKGYAFAFQALGLLYWEYRDSKELDDILQELDSMLDDFVYKKIWENLSKQDKRVILGIGEADSIQVKELCKKIDMKSQSMSKYRERLMNKGLIYSPEYGELSITLPRFYNVVRKY